MNIQAIKIHTEAPEIAKEVTRHVKALCEIADKHGIDRNKLILTATVTNLSAIVTTDFTKYTEENWFEEDSK